MKAVQSIQQTEKDGLAFAIAAAIAGLFIRLPMLSGFSVRRRATLTRVRDMAPLDADLCIADVAVHVWPGLQVTPAVRDEIVQTVRDLLAEHPDARQPLARGCTFARTFH